MADDLTQAIFVDAAERDAKNWSPKDRRRALPKKFYAQAKIAPQAGGYAILLDEKPVRTPGGRNLLLPSAAAADLLAAEWNAQQDFIDPATMPITRLANTAIDGVARDPGAVRDDIVKFLGSDLLCYRAGEPEALVAAQAAAWDPILDFARKNFGARFILAQGVMFTDQPAHAILAAARAVDSHSAAEDSAMRLAALHSMTTLTGSALIALAHVGGALDLEEAWSAAHVDEDFQIKAWGADAEAVARRARRFEDFRAASRLFAAL